MGTDAGGPLDDAGADLEQPLPEGRKLGPGGWHPAGHGIAEGEQLPIGRGVQDEAELVGDRALASGPVGGELALVQLDQVLRHERPAWQAPPRPWPPARPSTAASLRFDRVLRAEYGGGDRRVFCHGDGD